MKIGFIGLGKLGLPVSVAMSQKGHKVYGYDIDEEKMALYRQGIPATGSDEPNLRGQLLEALTENLYLCNSIYEVLNYKPEIVFVGVPTPSLPDDSFDTSYVKDAVREIMDNTIASVHIPIISVVSTVLPMTMRDEVAPIIDGRTALIYNPYFIAMGTVIDDFLYPEFELIGGDDKDAMNVMESFYRTIIPEETPILKMTWENAEAGKVCYNTIIGFKIVIANTIMELCHKIPYADCDVITDIFHHATKRIVGSKYLRGGMGDGGLCHPRDNRALSWLSDRLMLSTNPFDFIMDSRDRQAEWLALLVKWERLPVIIMGKRFKANSNLVTDSASVLVAEYLENLHGIKVRYHDPGLDRFIYTLNPHVFLVAIDEPWTREYPYPQDSTVIDVWRQFTEEDIDRLKNRDIKYIPVGRNG